MFVWVFHRISGIALIGLLLLQLLTGFCQASSTDSETARTVAALHRNAALNCLLVFLVIFHAAYGVRTMLLDLGVRRPRLLFWVCTTVGLILFVTFLASYLVIVSA